jgi:peptidoglycan hydrolase-like protein with peptidoglycan-binding domain
VLKKLLTVLLASILISITFIQPVYAYSDGAILKSGTRSSDVYELQRDLASLGYFQSTPTGYFGNITESALIRFQNNNSLSADGIAGSDSLQKISELKNSAPISPEGISRDQSVSTELLPNSKVQLLPWFDQVNKIYAKGDTATVIDIETGLSMQIKRTYGTNHADVETLTQQDTDTLLNIAGGSWNWTRRAVIVEIDGYRIAGSLTAMPHAGRDDQPANAIVSGRSGGYGRGSNLDAVKDNGMNGQFDIHFFGSRTHRSNRVDKQHQAEIQEAFDSGM